MNKTKIEWVRNPDFTGIPPRDAKGRFQYQGYTWNPITGCLNHVNGMCKGVSLGYGCYIYFPLVGLACGEAKIPTLGGCFG